MAHPLALEQPSLLPPLNLRYALLAYQEERCEEGLASARTSNQKEERRKEVKDRSYTPFEVLTVEASNFFVGTPSAGGSITFLFAYEGAFFFSFPLSFAFTEAASMVF